VVDAADRLFSLAGVSPSVARFDHDGRRLYYLDHGSGPSVVLLQGAGGGMANWYRLLPALAADRRVLAPELPGFGLSDGIVPVAPLGDLAAAVLDRWMADRIAGPADVIATSFGGLVALRLALRSPERIRRLVLLAPAGLGRDLPMLVRLAAMPGLGAFLMRPTRAGAAFQFRSLMTSGGDVLPAGHAEALIDYLWRSSDCGGARFMADALRAFADLSGQREVLTDPELSSIPHPTLIVWGGADRFLPRTHGERAAALIPSSELQVIEGAGHSVNWEAPDRLLLAIESFHARTSGT
jgi:pimeloyl-ACP methyl ester carboxylesterase